MPQLVFVINNTTIICNISGGPLEVSLTYGVQGDDDLVHLQIETMDKDPVPEPEYPTGRGEERNPERKVPQNKRWSVFLQKKEGKKID